jgi:tetratricopeptide (TPR) repeat protein
MERRRRKLLIRRALKRARAAERDVFPRRLSRSMALMYRALAGRPDNDERILLLAGLAAMHEQSAARGDDKGLETAVELLTEAGTLAPLGHPNAGPLLINLALAHSNVFTAAGNPQALEEAVRIVRSARTAIGADHPDRAGLLNTVAGVLIESEEHLDRPELLDEAIEIIKLAVPDGPGLHNLALAHRARFERLGDPADVIEAHRFIGDAILHGATAERFAELGHLLRIRHGITGEAQFADDAAKAWRRAIEQTPEGDDEREARLAGLAAALLDSHQAGNPDVLPEALVHARSALAADRPDLVVCQTAATVFSVWAEHHQDPSVLAEAESAARKAVLAADSNRSDRATALDTLSSVLFGKFKSIKDVNLLEQAIKAGEEAVALAADPVNDRAGHLGNLGSLRFARYTFTGDRPDLDAAIDLDRRAVGLLTNGDPELPRYLNNLGIALRQRYEISGAAGDLEGALVNGRAAAQHVTSGPDQGFRLSNLGSSLLARHNRFGVLDDLDEAVDLQRKALRLVPADHPDRAVALGNLGIALRVRHGYLGAEGDLREAVEAFRGAMSTVRAFDRLNLISAYGVALHVLFEATDERAFLAQAIEQLRTAVAESRVDDPELPQRIGNLVTVLEGSGPADSSSGAADEAVDAARQAVRTLPAGHPDLPALRSGLALALLARKRGDDLDEAVRMATAAVDAADADHPDLAGFRSNLGLALHTRFLESQREVDLDQAIESLREAARSDAAPPAVRLRAAHAWGTLSAQRGEWADAAEGLGRAVELLPEVSLQRLERLDGQRWLADYSGLAGEAAAMSLTCDQPERALRLLELGRGVLLNRLLRLGDDLTPLRVADAELAKQFEHLRHQLDQHAESEPFVAEGGSRGDAHAQIVGGRRRELRRDLVREFTRVMKRVQAIPELTGFLRPPTVEDLVAEASHGPVAVVNVSSYRCDVLLLTTRGLRHVPLPHLQVEAVDRLAFEFHKDLACAGDMSRAEADRGDAEKRLTVTLDWLWTTIARPVLSELEQSGDLAAGSVIRLVATGSLAFLPVHAATARDGSGSLLDHPVSYIPTVSALCHARRKQPNDGADVPRLVLISTYQDGDSAPLPSTEVEARRVAQWLAADLLDAAEVDRGTVLSAIGACSHVHVALHAWSDAGDPSRSSLLLGDFSLSVVDIASTRNERAELAYLSACETTLSTAALADESIHLTSAFQIVGFRRVVGTLWQIPDSVARGAARTFYRHLSGSADNSVMAAHETTLYLRDRYLGRPSVWAAYHHVG